MTQYGEQGLVSDERNWQLVCQGLAIFSTLFLLFGLLVVFSSNEAFGRATSPIQQSNRASNGAGGNVGNEEDFRELEPGKRIRRELAGGQRQIYHIRLDADQFLKVIIEQDGIDVVAQVLGPEGRQILEVDFESRKQGQEFVLLVAEAPGDYRVIIQPKQRRASAGNYEIWVEEVRAATNDDRALHEARKLYWEAGKLQQAGKYDEALSVIERALGIREKLLGPDHHETGIVISGLAILYSYKGSYTKAEPLFRRALDIQEKALGTEHPLVATALNNLALLYYEKGDYDKAEPLLQRALSSRERLLGAEHLDVAQSLNNLAVIYRNKGDYEKAEPLFERALSIWEKALGPEHPFVAAASNNLAIIYRNKGDYGKAEPLYERALSIYEKTLGLEHPSVAAVLNNLATLCSDRGDYTKAETLRRRALTILEKSLGAEHPDVARTLNNLADLYRERGDYGRAEPLYQRTLAILEKAVGREHPYVGDALNDLAALHTAKGEIAQAITFQSRANAVGEHNLALNFDAGSERQKLAYLALFSKQTDFTLWLHSQKAPNDQQALNLAFTTLLRRKGRGLDGITNAIAALRRHATPEDQTIFDQLAEARSRLAAFTLRESAVAKPNTYRMNLRPLEEEVEELEEKLSSRSAGFRLQTQPVTLADVQSTLPASSALVEFTVCGLKGTLTEKGKPPRYLAYVLPAQGQPRWVDLGETSVIDQAIDVWRKALRDPNRMDVKRLARAVDEKVMRPVRLLLGETRHLLIAPDGQLNLIPFAALVDERNHYLVQRYAISYLTSGRDLLRLETLQPSQNAPLVVANPIFGWVETIATQAGQSSGNSQAGDQKWAQIEPTTVFFQSLPGTEREALAIKAILPGASALLREQATETSLKQSKAPSVLHIATHGFFFSDQEAQPEEMPAVPSDDPLRISMRLSKLAAKIENPLLRSGLALAGANERRSGNDDGVLTAMEVASLDLCGTRLVVLSGCDTGMGEVKNGEGVYGLRRALVLAGSETQVLSLWPVSDKETRNLMVGYYRRLLKGEGRGEALRQIQLGMLKDAKLRHPYYWGNFIQAGEWANLDGQR